MDGRQLMRYGAIMSGMNAEVQSLLKKRAYHHNWGMESGAHVLMVERESSVTESVVRSLVSQVAAVKGSGIDVRSAGCGVFADQTWWEGGGIEGGL